MAKVSPVSIKYMIHANFIAEGALEKPDVIGALFGQTEGLLGADLEMRDLQKEGKIGRIEVELERNGKQTTGRIKIPTALDQSETTLIAAAIETIERMGPTDSQIEISRIEDVRGSKRDYIIERAKKLMQEIQGSSDSSEISNEIKDSVKMASLSEHGSEKLPCGDLSGREIIVVEGRADVLNLLKNGVNNVIAMNGTKLPEAVKELGHKKDLILFVDGDRGGKLIAQNVVDNTKVKYIASAPDGKEVEELTGKEILMNLRKRVAPSDFLSKGFSHRSVSPKTQNSGGEKKRTSQHNSEPEQNNPNSKTPKIKIPDTQIEKLKEIAKKTNSKAIILDQNLNKINDTTIKGLTRTLKRLNQNAFAIIINGTLTNTVLQVAEEEKTQVIMTKNFSGTDTDVVLVSYWLNSFRLKMNPHAESSLRVYFFLTETIPINSTKIKLIKTRIQSGLSPIIW